MIAELAHALESPLTDDEGDADDSGDDADDSNDAEALVQQGELPDSLPNPACDPPMPPRCTCCLTQV